MDRFKEIWYHDNKVNFIGVLWQLFSIHGIKSLQKQQFLQLIIISLVTRKYELVYQPAQLQRPWPEVIKLFLMLN